MAHRYDDIYFKPGSHILGAVLSLRMGIYLEEFFNTPPLSFSTFVFQPVIKNYQHVLALHFAINEINQDVSLLPNATLGFQIYDNFFQPRLNYDATLSLLSEEEGSLPNFKCGKRKKRVAVIGGLSAAMSMQIATVLGLFHIPQLSYGSFKSISYDTSHFPFTYQMIPSESLQYKGIVELLQYFRWIWIGLVVSNDNTGEEFVQNLKPLFNNVGICVAFTEKTPQMFLQSSTQISLEFNFVSSGKFLMIFHKTKANVIVVHGDASSLQGLLMVLYTHYQVELKMKEKVWITTTHGDLTSKMSPDDWNIKYFHGSLSLTIQKNVVPGFQTFIHRYDPYQHRSSLFMKHFWNYVFSCIVTYSQKTKESQRHCARRENLADLPGTVLEMSMSDHSYSIYNAVYAVAHALNAMYSQKQAVRTKGGRMALQGTNLWEMMLHPYLRKIHFNNSAGNEIFFSENLELWSSSYDIVNLVSFPNTSFARVKVGMVDSRAGFGQGVHIKTDAIQWPKAFNQTLPQSICSERCHPGHYRKIRKEEQSCSYDCFRCQGGTISKQTDAYRCDRCPDDEKPNKNHDGCVSKLLAFLAYSEPLGIGLAATALFFSLLTIIVFLTFVKYQNTPIVKANNRKLTYILLISLLLCFLCSLLFIGQPSKTTCLLRQVAFGNIFSLALSCVLAKTVTVILAFRATNPGNTMKKWVGKNLPSYLIMLCFTIQVGICAIWLVTSPPFPDLDMVSQAEKIVVQCNEGSESMFLAYMIVQAIVIFTVSYLSRKLPNTFNEAKLITFSMLVFCSVWLSFIPIYLGNKGKYIVAAEIFCILASSAALLSCIFAPKIYIILLKPSMNTREQLFKNICIQKHSVCLAAKAK